MLWRRRENLSCMSWWRHCVTMTPGSLRVPARCWPPGPAQPRSRDRACLILVRLKTTMMPLRPRSKMCGWPWHAAAPRRSPPCLACGRAPRREAIASFRHRHDSPCCRGSPCCPCCRGGGQTLGVTGRARRPHRRRRRAKAPAPRRRQGPAAACSAPRPPFARDHRAPAGAAPCVRQDHPPS